MNVRFDASITHFYPCFRILFCTTRVAFFFCMWHNAKKEKENCCEGRRCKPTLVTVQVLGKRHRQILKFLFSFELDTLIAIWVARQAPQAHLFLVSPRVWDFCQYEEIKSNLMRIVSRAKFDCRLKYLHIYSHTHFLQGADPFRPELNTSNLYRIVYCSSQDSTFFFPICKKPF